ncbi:MAG: Hsp20/alpha crystallin family protein [Candidatus Krumholzibacteriota bacterium]|nr:Hsp20/alpha crystallin family protein [Candidatus Krumholzibacteriota bacterium]
MRLVRYNKNLNLPVFSNDWERLVNQFLGCDLPAVCDKTDWAPRIDVEEMPEKFELTAELPGMEKEKINIEVQDNILTIRGEKKREREEKDNNYRLLERSFGAFTRSFVLPENILSDQVEADYQNGILKIGIPKKEPAKPKEIKIKVK